MDDATWTPQQHRTNLTDTNFTLQHQVVILIQISITHVETQNVQVNNAVVAGAGEGLHAMERNSGTNLEI